MECPASVQQLDSVTCTLRVHMCNVVSMERGKYGMLDGVRVGSVLGLKAWTQSKLVDLPLQMICSVLYELS